MLLYTTQKPCRGCYILKTGMRLYIDVGWFASGRGSWLLCEPNWLCWRLGLAGTCCNFFTPTTKHRHGLPALWQVFDGLPPPLRFALHEHPELRWGELKIWGCSLSYQVDGWIGLDIDTSKNTGSKSIESSSIILFSHMTQEKSLRALRFLCVSKRFKKNSFSRWGPPVLS